MKKIIALTLCLSMASSMMIQATFAYQDSASTEIVNNIMSATAFDTEQQSGTIAIDISSEHMYYDPEIDADVVAFTRNGNGTINYLTKEEADAIIKSSEDLDFIDPNFDLAENITDTEIAPLDYHDYYKFNQISGPVKAVGPVMKVSRDIEYAAGGAHISRSCTVTSTHSFSASVTTTQQKQAIQAGASIAWQTSASATETVTYDLEPGQKGYIGFYPYYDRVYGDLEHYGNWGDGLISSTKVYGYSVKLIDTGEADGLFTFILYR